MISPTIRMGGNRMDLYEQVLVTPTRRVGVVRDRSRELSDTEVAYADINDDLAKYGRFDEDGGELSDEDWADSQ